MNKILRAIGAIFMMWLAGGCAARNVVHRAIPNCGAAQAFVPGECYSVVVAGKVEVRCPNATYIYACGKKN